MTRREVHKIFYVASLLEACGVADVSVQWNTRRVNYRANLAKVRFYLTNRGSCEIICCSLLPADVVGVESGFFQHHAGRHCSAYIGRFVDRECLVAKLKGQ